MENLSEPDTGARLSRLTVQGEEIIIDEADYPFVKKLGLTIVRRENLKHVAINTKPFYKKYLHRVLLGVTDPNIIVDHKDNNGLNNRRLNLRKTDKTGNALNMSSHRDKKSGLPKGVFKERDGFCAQVQINYICWYLGHFKTIEEAETAYLRKVQSYWAAQNEI